MKNKSKYSRRHLARHLDKRLRMRFRFFLIIAVVMLGIIIFDVLTSKVSLILAILGMILGGIIGTFSSRMYYISWDKDASKVVSQFDIFGGIILLLYILFELKRTWIASLFIQGPMIGSMSFALLAGSMVGRVLGTRGKIMKILREQKIFA